MDMVLGARLARVILLYFVLTFGFLLPASFAATPCDGIDQKLTAQEKLALATAIMIQLNDKEGPGASALQHVSRVDIYKKFVSGQWSVIYLEPDVADPAYLFYRNDPMTSPWVDLWGDAAPSNQRATINTFVLRHDAGIPVNLAKCFAWAYTGG